MKVTCNISPQFPKLDKHWLSFEFSTKTPWIVCFLKPRLEHTGFTNLNSFNTPLFHCCSSHYTYLNFSKEKPKKGEVKNWLLSIICSSGFELFSCYGSLYFCVEFRTVVFTRWSWIFALKRKKNNLFWDKYEWP